MSFIDRNQRFVRAIYKEIESKMIEFFEKGMRNPRVFTYVSSTTKAFCMPEINAKGKFSTFKELYHCKLEVTPIARVGRKLVLVAYCPEISVHKTQFKELCNDYASYPIIKIREKENGKRKPKK